MDRYAKAPRAAAGKDARKAVGKAGEDAAEAYLRQAGFAVEARNWRCRSGEIDLIAREGGVLVFVEVRSRSNPTRFGTAIEAVTPRKCRQVREVASVYLKGRAEAAASVRFDVVAVTFGGDGAVEDIKHIPGAF